MDNHSKSFEDLLTEGIYAIQRVESKDRKKNIEDVISELSEEIGRKKSTLEWYRKGNLPKSQYEIEHLAKEIYIRGNMDKDWLEWFLKKAKHPNWKIYWEDIAKTKTISDDISGGEPYYRTKYQVDKQINLDGSCNNIIYVNLIATSEIPVSQIRHRIITNKTIEQFKFELLGFKRDDGGVVSGEIYSKTASTCTSKMDFKPPLIKGKKAFYYFQTYYKSLYDMTADVLYKNFLAGVRKREYESWTLTMHAPTDELIMNIQFPHNYPITFPTGGFGVFVNNNAATNEKNRLISERAFTIMFDNNNNQWSVKLNVLQARFNYSYEIQWLPPFLSEIS